MKSKEKNNEASAPLAYSISALCKAAGNVSRGTIYNEIKAGRLETKKIGRRRIATADQARAWLERLKS